MGGILLQCLLNSLCTRATEDHNVEQRVGSKTVGSVNTHTRNSRKEGERERGEGEEEEKEKLLKEERRVERTMQPHQQPSNLARCDLGFHPVVIFSISQVTKEILKLCTFNVTTSP